MASAIEPAPIKTTFCFITNHFLLHDDIKVTKITDSLINQLCRRPRPIKLLRPVNSSDYDELRTDDFLLRKSKTPLLIRTSENSRYHLLWRICNDAQLFLITLKLRSAFTD